MKLFKNQIDSLYYRQKKIKPNLNDELTNKKLASRQHLEQTKII